MDFGDHVYTSTIYDYQSPSDFTHKMTDREVADFVRLRISNTNLFSGRKNSSMVAWGAILEHMNLQHKMTYLQASKKWENLKKKYKELKHPPEGVQVIPENWRYFKLMDDALEGRLECDVPILKNLSINKDVGDSGPVRPKKRRLHTVMNSAYLAGGSEIEVSLNGDKDGEEWAAQEGDEDLDHIMQEVDNERDMMDSERLMMEREKQMMDRERMVLQRERAVLDREMAAVERDRASLERERATIEREKAMLERERAMVERERAEVSRNKLSLERERAKLARLFATKERTMGEEGTQDGSQMKDSEDTNRKERFLNLFEKLIDNF
ncbi:uncharacterized protein si:dkeyp-38g8.5 isoform X1 [Xyrichtys novacula]|uniref:Uncharacterized protein si:dkeyp-38g8.5 isoform X1 n=1 Tax=Xyrichtys novacula TaxID=13765 RepID=A0AAV1F191_XYRNO|nr:uncharacterized protein si:dkeyp-38g8.5 isoform X1 [Xyrichtys novacula]